MTVEERLKMIIGDLVISRCALETRIEELDQENWQLKQACGYPIPAGKETINNPFKCGICDARRNEQNQPSMFKQAAE